MVLKPPSQVGTLIVVTTPVSEDLTVLLDGKSLGTRSPIIRDDVQLGAHNLTVRAPGYKEQVFNVNIESASMAYHVPVNFGRPLNQSSGVVDVATEPAGAIVMVDGIEIGATPTTVPGRDPTKPVVVMTWLCAGQLSAADRRQWSSHPARTRRKPASRWCSSIRMTAIAPASSRLQRGRRHYQLGSCQAMTADALCDQRLASTEQPFDIKVTKQGYNAQFPTVRFAEGAKSTTLSITLEAQPTVDGQSTGGVGGPLAHNDKDPKDKDEPKKPPKSHHSDDYKPLPRKADKTDSGDKPTPSSKPDKDADTPGPRTKTSVETPKDKPVPAGCSGDGAKLSVNTIGEVNCQVQIGVKKLGGAPVFKQSVPIGKCEVRVTCPSGKQYKTTVSLNKGDDEKVIVKPGMWQ